MSKNRLDKNELKVSILKLKHQLYEESYMDIHKELAHKYLNAVLGIIEEYIY
jgi:hypothetical protein